MPWYVAMPVGRQNCSRRIRQWQHWHHIEHSVRMCTGDVTAHHSYFAMCSSQSKAAARKVILASLKKYDSTRPAPQTTRSMEKLMRASTGTVTPTSVASRHLNNLTARVSESSALSTAKTRALTTPHTATITSQYQAKDNPPSNDLLSRLLSSGNLSSPLPDQLPATSLRPLYIFLKRRSQLHRLTSKQLTELLSLMGSLSVPAPRAPCIYLSKLTSCVTEPSFQVHWPFIMEIARDKEQLGYALNGTDRYWIMRAQLTKVVVAEGETLRSGECLSYERAILSNL
jgi:hypothetical protein